MADAAALERLETLLQTCLADLSSVFESRWLDEDADMAKLVSPWESPGTLADLDEIRRFGAGDLLDEIAEDFLEESIQRATKAFWPRLGGTGPVGHRLEAAARGLVALRRTQAALLGALGVEKRLLRWHDMAFRSAFEASWTGHAADCVEAYFAQTWRHCLRQRPEPRADEWWCWSSRRPLPPAQCILALLQRDRPRRRQSATARRDGSWSHLGLNPLLAEEQDVDMAGGDDEAEWLQDDDAEDDSLQDDGSNTDLAGLCEISKAMMAAGLRRSWSDLVMRFFSRQLTTFIEDRCRSEFDKKGLLDRLTQLLYSTMLRWLRAAFGVAPVAAASLPEDEADFQAEEAWWSAARSAALRFFEAFLEIRLGEAFDLMRDFPESAPALLDLRRCLALTGQAAPLVEALREQISRRLLIAGAHTRDVIKVYIKTIKALRLIDPRGLLLDGVSAPIREYLKKRKDTVRCIITALTEDTELQQELQQGAEALASASKKARLQPGQPALPAQNDVPDFAGEDFEASGDEEDPDCWAPDPFDVDPQKASRHRRAQDVVSLLVGIYGSKEMFIKEYKEMLADRLLANPTYHAEREMQNLELLKTRFGDAALVHCEVMLQDIKDSKRVNSNVQQLKGDSRGPLGPIHPLVLSQHYWPPALSKADHPRFRLPAQLEDALAEYGNAYTKTKAKRSLQWQRAHGVVEITVQLADRTLDVTVTPIHYAVLACFSEASNPDAMTPTRLSLQDLTSQLELPEALVRKRVGFWVAKGVLKEVSANIFELQESAPSMDGVNVDIETGHLDDDTESPGPPARGRSREACSKELRACESFLQGMLKNYTTLTLSRIHNFLQRFMMEPAYTQSEAQLREFLAQLVQEGKLEFDGSSYTLVQAAAS